MGTEGTDWAALKKIEALPEAELVAHRALIHRVAMQLGLPAEGELVTLVARERAVIKEGSARLMVAITSAQTAYAAGNAEAARELLRRALAAERIGYYREILTAELGRRS